MRRGSEEKLKELAGFKPDDPTSNVKTSSYQKLESEMPTLIKEGAA